MAEEGARFTGSDNRSKSFQEGSNALCERWCYRMSNEAKRTKVTKRKIGKSKIKTRRTKEGQWRMRNNVPCEESVRMRSAKGERESDEA